MADELLGYMELLLQKEFQLLRQQQREQHEQMLAELRCLTKPGGSGHSETTQPAAPRDAGEAEQSTMDLPNALPFRADEAEERDATCRGKRGDAPEPGPDALLDAGPNGASQPPPMSVLPVPGPPLHSPALIVDTPGPPSPTKPGSARTTSTTLRGSKLKELNRTSQACILQADRWISDEILFQQIGVNLFTSCGHVLSGVIGILLILQMILMGVVHIYGHVHPASYVWTSVTTWFFSVAALCSILQIRKAVHSEGLHLGLSKLEAFVRDIGCGLDWHTMALRERNRAIAMWMLLAVFFLGLHVIEQRDIDMGLYDSEVRDIEMLPLARQLSHITASLNCVAFLLSSMVVVKAAWFQCNLLVGLSQTIDCWCGDMLHVSDFNGGVGSWNTIQAMLKSVSRALAPCFLTLQVAGQLGLVTSVAGAFSVVLVTDPDAHILVSSIVPMLPLLVLFGLSARLLGQGGALTKKCQDVVAFVNQLGAGQCAGRQYLVQFIVQSRAGFIVAGITVTNGLFVKQMAAVATFLSSLAGDDFEIERLQALDVFLMIFQRIFPELSLKPMALYGNLAVRGGILLLPILSPGHLLHCGTATMPMHAVQTNCADLIPLRLFRRPQQQAVKVSGCVPQC